MAAARSFEDLIVWQKAHKFVLSVYELSSNFPKSETYGLTSQLRRAAVSIPANIAEGFKKRTAKVEEGVRIQESGDRREIEWGFKPQPISGNL